jgi:hypothetical protein
MNAKELADIFRQLGADDPDAWASSEVNEGIPQLARFLFQKGAWDRIVSNDELSWIDRLIANVPPESNAPFSSAPHSIRRMLQAGVSYSDIASLVRSMQAEFLFELCYMMGDSMSVNGNESLVGWGLVELDANNKPGRHMAGLHESVLVTDPTGRKVRPI